MYKLLTLFMLVTFTFTIVREIQGSSTAECFLTLLRAKVSSRSFVILSFPAFSDFLVGAGENAFAESAVVDMFGENVLFLLFALLDGLNMGCDQGRECDGRRLEKRRFCNTRLT